MSELKSEPGVILSEALWVSADVTLAVAAIAAVFPPSLHTTFGEHATKAPAARTAHATSTRTDGASASRFSGGIGAEHSASNGKNGDGAW